MKIFCEFLFMAIINITYGYLKFHMSPKYYLIIFSGTLN